MPMSLAFVADHRPKPAANFESPDPQVETVSLQFISGWKTSKNLGRGCKGYLVSVEQLDHLKEPIKIKSRPMVCTELKWESL